MSLVLWIYVVFAEIVFFAWIGWTVKEHDAELPDTSQWTWYQKTGYFSTISLAMFVVAPFALPVMCFLLWKCYRQATKEHKQKYGRHVELRLEPLHSLNMPDALAKYIEEHEPDALSLNFKVLGDFWLKDEPYNSKARLYLSDDQMHFAEIGFTLGTYYCELISFLDDGTMIGSANCEPYCDPLSRKKLGYCLNLVGDEASFSKTTESHLRFVEETSRTSGEAVRKMSLENWKDYYRYHNRKYGKVRFELGEAIDQPETCEFPAEDVAGVCS